MNRRALRCPAMVVRCLISLLVAAVIGGTSVIARGDSASEAREPLTFVVGYGEGSVFDRYTRLLARHMSRHLNRVQTRIENRVGDVGMVAAMYMYKQAKPDGRTIGNWSGDLVLKQIFGGEQVTFDVRRFNWVGTIATKHPVCVLTRASGIERLEEWSKATRPLRLGAIGHDGTTPQTARILAHALGLPIKLIDGYKGTTKVRLAAETQELDGGCLDWQSVKRWWAKMLETGDAKVVLQAMTQAHRDLPDVPNAIDLARNSEAKTLIRHGVHDPATIARLYSLPPGTPRDRVAPIREAFDKTVKDPAFVAEAQSLGLEVDPVNAAGIERTVTGLFALDPKRKVELRKLLFPEKPNGKAMSSRP